LILLDFLSRAVVPYDQKCKIGHMVRKWNLNSNKSENELREQRILNAAEQLISYYGYDKTTVGDIATEAAISKGAIYLHFQSKEELFEALLLRELSRYSEKWLQLIEADPEGGTLAGVYKNTLYAMKSSPFIAGIFKQDRKMLGNYIRKEGNLFQRMGAGGSLRSEFIRMMQDAGAIRQDINPKIIAHIMNMLSVALVSMDEVMISEDIPPMEATIEAIADLMHRGLTPADGGNSEAGKTIIRQIMDMTRQQITQMKKPEQE
jgi:AcrR family transcriptional regulator